MVLKKVLPVPKKGHKSVEKTMTIKKSSYLSESYDCMGIIPGIMGQLMPKIA